MEFKNGDTIDYSKDGRRKLVIHLVTSGQRKYEIEDRIFSAEKGTLIFIPEGTTYKTKAQSLNNKLCSGIGIRFNTNPTIVTILLLSSLKLVKANIAKIAPIASITNTGIKVSNIGIAETIKALKSLLKNTKFTNIPKIIVIKLKDFFIFISPYIKFILKYYNT